MSKGIFTAGVAIMLREPCDLDAVAAALTNYVVMGRNPASKHWELGGPSLTISYRPEVNGVVLVDTVDRAWPDEREDPDKEPTLFGARSAGHFGPFGAPGGLARAAEQNWVWRDGENVPEQHSAFLRIRSSYVLGKGDDAPVAPEDYDPKAELLFVTQMASALLELEKAIAYYNPSGEVLMGKKVLNDALKYSEGSGHPPLDTWANIRLFGVDEKWKLMDTVGMSQLDVPDLEACFEVDRYRPGDVDQMLRTISLYMLQRGQVIKSGDVVPGAGGVHWRASMPQDPLSAPARKVLRFFPQDGSVPSDHIAPLVELSEPQDPSNLPS